MEPRSFCSVTAVSETAHSQSGCSRPAKRTLTLRSSLTELFHFISFNFFVHTLCVQVSVCPKRVCPNDICPNERFSKRNLSTCKVPVTINGKHALAVTITYHYGAIVWCQNLEHGSAVSPISLTCSFVLSLTTKTRTETF